MSEDIDIQKAFINYDKCLVNLSNSILKRFGAKILHPTLDIADNVLSKGYKNVVLLLLDAMGISILEKHLKADGFLRSHLISSYSSVYPPTTVAATTSVLSGLYPNEHGWLGWDVYYPKLDKNVTAFLNSEQVCEASGAKPLPDGSWDESSLQKSNPAAEFNAASTYCPYESIVDLINKAGGKAYYSMPFEPPFPNSFDNILKRAGDLCKEEGEKFIYAYWNEPDSTMHATGTRSDETHQMMTILEKKVEEFASSLEDTLLFVTADHGHIDCRNLCILDYPELMNCLIRLPSIEPRTLNMFVKDEYRKDFPKIFKKNLGDGFLLLTREEVLSRQLFGIGQDHKELSLMLGDYIAVASDNTAVFATHYEAQKMPGGHAGLTAEEINIPLIAVDCGIICNR